MAEISSISPRPEMKSNTSPRPRALNRLRERFSKENKSSPNLLGVKIKRFSELENYSGRSRGTLGGFLTLPDMGSPDIDSLSLEKYKNVEKECVLTQLTKKIGLGIYTRGRDQVAEKVVGQGYVDLDGDERETWYMFYPPPPSPSLALEPKDWDSASSPELDSNASSPPSVPNVVLEAEFEPEDPPRLSTFTQGSQYATSNPTSPTSPTEHRPNQGNTTQDVDIDALVLSAENLAEQYRGLLLTPDATPRLPSHHPHSDAGISPLPFPSPLAFQPPTRPETPRTIRKIRRRHSLRKLIDATDQPQMTTMAIPTPLTPPPSATRLTPLTPPPAIRSPDFLSSTFTPELLHPTRLSLAAHPNRSPTPSQHHHRSSSDAKRKKKKSRRNVSQPPEPPPRESSRGRGRAGKKRPKGGMGDGVEGLGAMAKGNGRREDDQERGRHKEMPRRYGVVDMGDEGGWL